MTEQIRTNIPRECHLWNRKGITAEEVVASLATVKSYEDESHLIRRLLKCRDCAHLYFYEFYEIVDWDEGNDAQYRSWIPVDDPESADKLNDLSPMALLPYPALRQDFPSNASQPTAPQWRVRQGQDR